MYLSQELIAIIIAPLIQKHGEEEGLESNILFQLS